MLWVKTLARGLWRRLKGPSETERVQAVVRGIANMELLKNERRYLSPLPGMHGPVAIEGNATPSLNYVVFDKGLMEFVVMTAWLDLKGRILYSAVTADLGGVGVKDAYTAPLKLLLKHLARYFPYPMPVKIEGPLVYGG